MNLFISQLAFAKDRKDKKAINVATPNIRKAFQSRISFFVPRYKIENPKHFFHRSKTYSVHFAIDTKKKTMTKISMLLSRSRMTMS